MIFCIRLCAMLKKLVGKDQFGNETDLGEKFEGQFACAKFNCAGCNEGFVDDEAPKRNKE